SSTSLAQLSGQFFSLCFFKLCKASQGFWTQDVTTPVTMDLIVSVTVVCIDSLHQLCKGSLILQVNLGESNRG
ncbi:hypothetical protein N334_00146, partial [Pelecanus crispus]